MKKRFNNNWIFKTLFISILFITLFDSCSYIKYLSGDRRYVKHNLGFSATTDSLVIPINKFYTNEKIMKELNGVLFTFKTVDSLPINYIAWSNNWYTLVLKDEDGLRLNYYTFDKKNRLRVINRYSSSCDCYVSKIEFNKKGTIVNLENKGVSF